MAEDADVDKSGLVRTVIRMTIDKGWHTYWENPGEVGIPISIEAELPEGWKAGEIQYPVPHRITLSELTSFCFEGTILLPLTLTAPSGFAGKIPELRATISWLACNDQTCLPGQQQVALHPAPGAKLVAEAYDGLPSPLPAAKLTLAEDDKFLRMSLHLPADWKTDISGFSVFPITRNILHPATDFKFSRDPDKVSEWTASAPKDEYFEKIPESLSILVSDGSGKAWVISSGAENAKDSDG